MKALRWIAAIFLILLGACSNPPADSHPLVIIAPGQEPAGQENVGQAAGQNGTQSPVKSSLVVTDLRVEPDVVDVFHPAIIIVSVNNTGVEYGVFNVELKVDQQLFKTQVVALPGGASKNLTFDITPEQERNLWLSVGDFVRELIIQHS